MSAWIVSRAHIDTLVTALVTWEFVLPEQADDTGRMLWAECLASVAGHYPNDGDGDRPGPIDFKDADVTTYTFTGVEGRIDPLVVQIANQSYQYQSCEHAGWSASDARALSERLGQRCWDELAQFAERFGYLDRDAAAHGEIHAWDISDHGTFHRAEQARARTAVGA